MAVIKEYKCSDCTRIFDATIPSCIHCGSINVIRVFVTPFAFKSYKTKFSDDNFNHLMESYKLSDFSNNENTKHTPDRSSMWKSVSANAAGTGTVDPSDLQNFKQTSFPIDGIKAQSREWNERINRESWRLKSLEKAVK